MSRILVHLKNWFSFDLRSLALFRILLSFFVICDLLWRIGDLKLHYSDGGIFPRLFFLQEVALPWSFSLHLANGSEFFLTFLFFLHLLFAVLVFLGVHTRWATVGLFVMTVSLHNRNWFINNGGDDVLRSILFIAMFLPWGSRFSLQSKPAQTNTQSFSVWNFLFFFQVFAIYFFSYIMKNHPIWRSEYSAIYYANHLDIFSTSIGIWLRGFPSLMKGLTIYTIFVEYISPLALVFGFIFTKRFGFWVKMLVILSFMSLHLGIVATMSIGLFPFYCLAMWVAFLPKECWTRWGKFWEEFFSILFEYGNRIQTKTPRVLSAIKESFGLFMLIAIVMWNLTTLKVLNFKAPFWAKVVQTFHVYQEWNMFSPYPKMDNLWPEVIGEYQNGESKELITGSSDIYSTKKVRMYEKIRNEHWRKFYHNMTENVTVAKLYASYECRKDKELNHPNNGVPLKKITVYSLAERILPDYKLGEPVKNVMWTQWCSETEWELEKLKQKNHQ